MSGRGQSHEVAKNIQRKLWLMQVSRANFRRKLKYRLKKVLLIYKTHRKYNLVVKGLNCVFVLMLILSNALSTGL